jgi:hypothetical protein
MASLAWGEWGLKNRIQTGQGVDQGRFGGVAFLMYCIVLDIHHRLNVFRQLKAIKWRLK